MDANEAMARPVLRKVAIIFARAAQAVRKDDHGKRAGGFGGVVDFRGDFALSLGPLGRVAPFRFK